MIYGGIDAWLAATIARNMLREAGVDDAGFEARQLTAFVLSKSRLHTVDGAQRLTEAQAELLERCVQRRIAHEPLQYIIGEWEFMGLPFRVRPGVLIPRPETETLCEAAEALIRKNGYKRLLDACTGTGCVGIALAKRCGIDATLADVSPICVETATENALLNGVKCTVLETDLFDRVDVGFDLITVNPPYIKSGLLPGLQPEVMYEPALALDGGPDGLEFYRRIRREFLSKLSVGGALALETGYDQGAAVMALFGDIPNVIVTLHTDLEGRERVVTVELT